MDFHRCIIFRLESVNKLQADLRTECECHHDPPQPFRRTDTFVSELPVFSSSIYSFHLSRTLSIDLGSETTRISLSFEKVDRKNRVQKDVIHVRPQQYRTLDSKPDWLSLCNVLDRGTPYIGNGDIKRPKSTTMKLAIAWATDADDESLRDCPLMSVFREIEAKGPQEVISAKRRVKQACLLLFRKIDARTQAICEAHDIRIDSFVLTIPSHWKMKVEEYYESIIREAFGSEDNTDVHFLREVEADAHYLFHDEHACRTMIKTRLDNYKQCKFLIVDFGGFSFVSLGFSPNKMQVRQAMNVPMVAVEQLSPYAGGGASH